jgi:hypothetical protein
MRSQGLLEMLLEGYWIIVHTIWSSLKSKVVVLASGLIYFTSFPEYASRLQKCYSRSLKNTMSNFYFLCSSWKLTSCVSHLLRKHYFSWIIAWDYRCMSSEQQRKITLTDIWTNNSVYWLFFHAENKTRNHFILIGRTPDFHFEPTIMILHIIDKLLIQVVNIYFLNWKFVSHMNLTDCW